MHEFEAPFGAQFMYNSDLSGLISVHEANPTVPPIHIAYEDIRAFFLEMRRKRLITQLEEMDYDALDNL
jgi:hypothetical protein